MHVNSKSIEESSFQIVNPTKMSWPLLHCRHSAGLQKHGDILLVGKFLQIKFYCTHFSCHGDVFCCAKSIKNDPLKPIAGVTCVMSRVTCGDIVMCFAAVTCESLVSREFSRILLTFHFSISISRHFHFTFHSRSRS